MKNLKLALVSILLISSTKVYLQTNSYQTDFNDEIRGKNELRIMFYNLENFYDTRYDSTRTYNDFTPFGIMPVLKQGKIWKRSNGNPGAFMQLAVGHFDLFGHPVTKCTPGFSPG